MRNSATVLLAGAALSVLGAASAQAQPGVLFGTTGSVGGELITIDPATGDGTLRCLLVELPSVTAIAFRDDGVLFASTGGGSAGVIRLDPDDCSWELVGTHPYGSINGLEFVGNTLYGAFFQPPGGKPVTEPEGPGAPTTTLVIVDQTDATLTQIGPMPFIPTRGLAYDTATGTMYGTGSLAVEGGGDWLFTVNLATAETSPVGAHGTTLGAIEFGPEGTLYGGQRPGGGGGGAAPQGSASLFSVNTATGQATAIGVTGFGAVSGLSLSPGGEVESIIAIPTLSGMSLVTLSAALFAAGWFALRRRNAGAASR